MFSLDIPEYMHEFQISWIGSRARWREPRALLKPVWHHVKHCSLLKFGFIRLTHCQNLIKCGLLKNEIDFFKWDNILGLLVLRPIKIGTTFNSEMEWIFRFKFLIFYITLFNVKLSDKHKIINNFIATFFSYQFHFHLDKINGIRHYWHIHIYIYKIIYIVFSTFSV